MIHAQCFIIIREIKVGNGVKGHESDIYRFSTVGEVSLTKKTGKELRKIDWHIVKRVVVFLYYNSKTKKTNLATRCNLGYDKCIRYLDWMGNMDMIRREHDDEGMELISLNENGMSIFEKNFKDIS